MNVWVDADACPGAIKEILFKAADRRGVATTLYANHFVKVPKSPYLSSYQVSTGFDVADHRILAEVQAGDLVVTADVPLAAEVVGRGATALNPRGTLYTEENARDKLARRDASEMRRAIGEPTRGPAPLSRKDVQAFANQLDRFLTAAGA